MNGNVFDGEIVMRFPGPPAAHKHDDQAEEYVVVRNPHANGRCMIYAKYSMYRAEPEWILSQGNRHPIRVLIDMLREAKGEPPVDWAAELIHNEENHV